MTAHLRRIVPLAVALSSLVGTQAVTIAQADVPAAHTAKAKHQRHHHRHHHSRIPQHNGGDHDSDNNGGPSDGDGNV